MKFTKYFYDTLLDEKGSQTEVAKTLVSLGNALEEITEKEQFQYSKLLYRLIGMSSPPYRPDEAELIM